MSVSRESRSRVSRTKRRFVLAGASLAVVGVLVGCSGPTLAGSAAVVGDTRITDPDLEYQVNEVLAELNLEPSDRANQIILDRLIRGAIIDEMANQNQVSVSEGQVQTFLADAEKQFGGRAAIEQQLLQQGVPPSQITAFARTALLQQQIAAKLAPNKPQQEQGAIFAAAASKLTETLNIRVSPRFGSWSAEQLQVGPIPNDLSIPDPSQSSAAPLIPQQ